MTARDETHDERPETFHALLETIDRHTGSYIGEDGGNLRGWRGQANSTWLVESGAVRRVKPLEARADFGGGLAGVAALVSNYQRTLLERARSAGHDKAQHSTLGDLELLARLQHHGAATHLLDFSASALTALWFACRPPSNSPGVLIVLDLLWGLRPTADQVQEVASTEVGIDPTFSPDAATSGLWYWMPNASDRRMAAQQSMLAWSGIVDQPWGTFGPDYPRAFGSMSRLSFIQISPALKAEFRKRAGAYLGLSSTQLFPDLSGFAQAYGVTELLHPDDVRGGGPNDYPAEGPRLP